MFQPRCIDGKTRNDYFQDMLAEVLASGLRPAFTTGDSWYACENNLKDGKNHRMGLMLAVPTNCTVSVEKGVWVTKIGLLQATTCLTATEIRLINSLIRRWLLAGGCLSFDHQINPGGS